MSSRKKNRKQINQKNVWNHDTIRITVLVVAIVLVAGLIIWKSNDTKKNQQSAQNEPEASATAETYDPLNCVELGDYQGIEISLKVTKSDLKSEIDSILEEHVIYEQLSGTVAEGDMVYADFEGYIGDQVVEDTCGSDYIEIGSGEWLEGFESGIIGANTGETVAFPVAVPDGTYGDPSIDGQTVEFHVTVHYICGEEILPEYNNDFVQSISKKYDTVKQYNAYLRKKLRKENEEQKAEFTWSEVMSACEVTKYPKMLLADARQEVLQGYYDMAELYGCSQEEIFSVMGYGSQQEFMDSDLKTLAKDTAKEYLVAEAIAAKEEIEYSQEDFQALRDEEFSYVQDTYATVEEFEAEKKNYLEHQVVLKTVKEWLSAQAEYIG